MSPPAPPASCGPASRAVPLLLNLNRDQGQPSQGHHHEGGRHGRDRDHETVDDGHSNTSPSVSFASGRNSSSVAFARSSSAAPAGMK